MKLMVSSVQIQWNALMQHCSRPLLSGVEFTRTNQCTCKTTADQRKKSNAIILTNDHYYASLAFSSASFLACRSAHQRLKPFGSTQTRYNYSRSGFFQPQRLRRLTWARNRARFIPVTNQVHPPCPEQQPISSIA
jgi:hypothetical protein